VDTRLAALVEDYERVGWMWFSLWKQDALLDFSTFERKGCDLLSLFHLFSLHDWAFRFGARPREMPVYIFQSLGLPNVKLGIAHLGIGSRLQTERSYLL
jgi:hypothetical protein